jgi:hypothetical protein
MSTVHPTAAQRRCKHLRQDITGSGTTQSRITCRQCQKPLDVHYFHETNEDLRERALAGEGNRYESNDSLGVDAHGPAEDLAPRARKVTWLAKEVDLTGPTDEEAPAAPAPSGRGRRSGPGPAAAKRSPSPKTVVTPTSSPEPRRGANPFAVKAAMQEEEPREQIQDPSALTASTSSAAAGTYPAAQIREYARSLGLVELLSLKPAANRWPDGRSTRASSSAAQPPQ